MDGLTCQSGFTEVTRIPSHEASSHSIGCESLMQNPAPAREAEGHKVSSGTQVQWAVQSPVYFSTKMPGEKWREGKSLWF